VKGFKVDMMSGFIIFSLIDLKDNYKNIEAQIPDKTNVKLSSINFNRKGTHTSHAHNSGRTRVHLKNLGDKHVKRGAFGISKSTSTHKYQVGVDYESNVSQESSVDKNGIVTIVTHRHNLETYWTDLMEKKKVHRRFFGKNKVSRHKYGVGIYFL
jgi:hypothetical protein